MQKLVVTVKRKNGGEGVEGSYQLPNSTTTKLARKDGKTVFPNQGSLSQAVRRLARVMGWEFEIVSLAPKTAPKKRVKKAVDQTCCQESA